VVCVFAGKPAVLKHYVPAGDVVAESPATKGKTVLTFSGPHAFELLNMVRPGVVVGINSENLQG
jgi:hypothetical protein